MSGGRLRIAREPSDFEYLGDMDGLTVARAEQLLVGKSLIAALAGSIPEMKAMRDRCLLAGIAVSVGCPPGAGKG